MKRMAATLIVLCLLLSGCSFWMNGSYSTVVPHKELANQAEKPVTNVSDYEQLKAALISMVDSNAESGVLYMQYATDGQAHADLEAAVQDVCQNHPFAAYAVESMDYEFGTGSGKNAVRVRIAYLQNRVRREKIRRVEDITQIKKILVEQMEACETVVVLLFDSLDHVDYTQIVADCAMEHPQRVMEVPEVTVSLYPEEGRDQIVELKFAYQTNREELRTLQNKVTPVFNSAAQYVAGDWAAEEKAARLYTFLMERYEYNIQTSITPAYSLLLHGVGDDRAFAMIYAAMCCQSDVDCQVVTGTRRGTPWMWNVLHIDGVYYYLDLLRNKSEEGFQMYTKEEMTDYVWDYSAYAVTAGEIS